jgi:hypothetical protein
VIYDHLDRVCDCKCFSGSVFWPKHCFNGDLCNPKRETFWTGHNPRCRCRHSSFYVALYLRRPSANGSTSGYLFTPLKLAGAICLIWLSSSLWTAPTEQKPFEEKVKTASLLKLFWKSRVIRILTPKGPAFYVAFVPQFVSLSVPIFLQFVILITPFVSVAILTRLFWLFFPVICECSFKDRLC